MPAGAAAAPSKACDISIAVQADAGSFAAAGHDSRRDRLMPLVALVRDRFTAAARRLCAAGVLRRADLAGSRKLVVQNAEGATEPLIYRDMLMEHVFVFQYAFQDGGPPEPAAFEQALRCWKSPDGRGCDLATDRNIVSTPRLDVHCADLAHRYQVN